MSTFALVLSQARYANRSFWRNPAAAFFTFIFPLMFLIIFNLVFGDEDIEVEGGTVDTSAFYVPAILALAVINACYTALSQIIVNLRDQGLLKRMRGTPLPPLAFIAGRILQCIWVMTLLVVVVLAFGAIFYGVDVPTDRLPALVLALVFGAAAFCALGLAVTGFIPNADAAPAVVNATILPLLFISNVFIPTNTAPAWLNDFASIFPVVHLADSMHGVFNPFTTGNGIEIKDLAVLAAWAVVGSAIAARHFTWGPRR
jgi:ABC-2 type transport system permease protein